MERQQIVVAACIATLLSVRGKKRGSLTTSGAISAFVVGFLTLSCGYRFGTLLVGFYLTSTKLTKFKAEWKQKIDTQYKPSGGGRSANQVLACSVLGVFICLIYFFCRGVDQPIAFDQDPIAAFLWCCYISHYACCNGDTWASELGVLSQTEPVLITSLHRRVPRGTNGGISLVGTVASAAGGASIGLFFYLHSLIAFPSAALQYHAITLGFFTGLLGSMIDSFLGATVQATWYDPDLKAIVAARKDDSSCCCKRICGRDWLSNEQVNGVSVFVTTLLGGVLGSYLFN